MSIPDSVGETRSIPARVGDFYLAPNGELFTIKATSVINTPAKRFLVETFALQMARYNGKFDHLTSDDFRQIITTVMEIARHAGHVNNDQDYEDGVKLLTISTDALKGQPRAVLLNRRVNKM